MRSGRGWSGSGAGRFVAAPTRSARLMASRPNRPRPPFASRLHRRQAERWCAPAWCQQPAEAARSMQVLRQCGQGGSLTAWFCLFWLCKIKDSESACYICTYNKGKKSHPKIRVPTCRLTKWDELCYWNITSKLLFFSKVKRQTGSARRLFRNSRNHKSFFSLRLKCRFTIDIQQQKYHHEHPQAPAGRR